MSFLKNLFKKEKAPGQEYEEAVQRTHNQLQKIMAKEQTRRDHITKCAVLMKDCRSKFSMTIMNERDIANKKKNSGIPVDRERTRVQEAAIGILTVDMALFDLESVSSEADLNNAMNQMGKALRQLIRLDNSTASINSSARNFIDMFYPSFKSLVEDTENYTAVKKTTESAKRSQPTDIVSIYEIPEEIRARINETFVDNLMAGDSYEKAMYKAQKSPAEKAINIPSGGLSQVDWERINSLAEEADDGQIVKANTDT